MSNTKTSDTKSNILDAAEVLFAEHGYSQTSLRIITTVANVNLAAVNYHFGSKKALIQSVIDRYFDVFTGELATQFSLLETQYQKNSITTRELLESLIIPILKMNDHREDGSATFMKLLGHAYTESQGHLKVFLTLKYGNLLTQFSSLFKKANPNVDDREIFWRMHFMLGTFVFALAGHQALSDIAEVEFEEKVDTKGIILHLIPFLSAAMQSDPELDCT